MRAIREQDIQRVPLIYTLRQASQGMVADPCFFQQLHWNSGLLVVAGNPGPLIFLIS
jgi:hypothetical protein